MYDNVGGDFMRKFYLCKHCGNVVSLLVIGRGKLMCCGEEMIELEANMTDAALEKHVPVYEVDGDKIRVRVGEVDHPMEEKHYITFIALEYGDNLDIHYLKPGEEPEAIFPYIKGSVIYEFCNIHGLWKKEVI